VRGTPPASVVPVVAVEALVSKAREAAPFTLYLVDGHWVLDPTQPGLPVAAEPGALTPPGILVAARECQRRR
jgi:hypothetical protein